MLQEEWTIKEKGDDQDIGQGHPDWIEEQNKKITHWLCIIFVSAVTSVITTLLLTM